MGDSEVSPSPEGTQRGVFEKIGPESIGIGAFYYFVSAAVIDVMTYVGYGRSATEVGIFFFILTVTMVVVHLLAAFVPSFRRQSANWNAPVFGVCAVMAVVSMCFSMLGGVSIAFFYAGAVLSGFSCAGLLTTWATVISHRPVYSSSFRVPAALLLAVVFYVCYRICGLYSVLLEKDWQMAVPLIGMVALLMTYSPVYSTSELGQSRSYSFMILGIVALVFAIGCGFFAYLSGYPGATEKAEFTYMIPLEVIAALTVGLTCVCMSKLISAHGETPLARNPLVAFFLSLLPMFALGCITGFIYMPGGQSGLMWEASIWVIMLAVFAHDMRTSLYAMNGTAIGLLFEAWCMGQMLVRIHSLGFSSVSATVFLVVLGALYFIAIGFQLLSPRGQRSMPEIHGCPQLETRQPASVDSPTASIEEVKNESESENSDKMSDENMLENACISVGREHGLTDREIEVLALIAEGRSAKFISEKLVISYNTARSHIRHVYEKLDIHSKQDIISLTQTMHGKMPQ